MNSALQYLSFRYFYNSIAYNAKSSQQAKVMVKLMQGTTKKKSKFWYSEAGQSKIGSDLQGILAPKTQGNSKVSNRRVAVLNSVFLEKITDILSTSSVGESFHKHGFIITRVKYASDGSALHVYWNASKDVADLEAKLPSLGGMLRHELSQLQCGSVPHLNFIFDRTMLKANDVEELLRIADFGPDHIPLANRQNEEEVRTASEAPLVKGSNVLGIKRDVIINQVMKSMRHVPAESRKGDDSDLADVQRQIDFKKYLQSQKVLREKMAKKAAKLSDRELLALVDLNELRRTRRPSDDSEAHEWEEYLEDDFEDGDDPHNRS